MLLGEVTVPKSQHSAHLPVAEDVVWAQVCQQKWALVILVCVSIREEIKTAYLDHLSPYFVPAQSRGLSASPTWPKQSYRCCGWKTWWAEEETGFCRPSPSLVPAPMAYCCQVLDTFSVKASSSSSFAGNNFPHSAPFFLLHLP